MKYYKQYKDGSKPFEVSTDKARQTLDGHYRPDALNDIFNNEKSFRLQTPYSIVWTESDDGLIPMPNFYGVCE